MYTTTLSLDYKAITMNKKDSKAIHQAYIRLHSDTQITITVTKSELKEAFSTYENFKAFLLKKFGVDVDYLEYLERISNDDE